ncbi:MAG: molybdenum cofactor guanylyltransferase [Candidatus Delongbacteria bacterium]|nr:molybdenum cofactor guanylyltransferase [Candidatus Delongbacteria bacterium]MCG2760353.1 molybdenum cofactor guanylyltransferase [Candidatus Delongbacteria bacterium]
MKEKNYPKISCAVLAGGKSKRLNGANKALLQIGEKSNLEKIISFAKKYFSETLLITNDSKHYEFYKEVKIFEDLIKNIGPLGGIHSALKNAEANSVFFFPCDMPFLKEELIKKEIDIYIEKNCEVIIPRIGEFIEPLHSIFSKNLLTKLEEHIKITDNYAIRSFFDKADVFYWDIEDSIESRKSFFNINTHHDLNEAKKK